jgi:sugar lactone lactonase YvrE
VTDTGDENQKRLDQVEEPQGLALAPDNYFALTSSGDHIAMGIKDEKVTFIAGDGSTGFRDGTVIVLKPGTGSTSHALFNAPTGLAFAPDSSALYVADTGNHAIRKINLAKSPFVVTTVAGFGKRGFQDGPASSALFAEPGDVVVMGDGSLLVADRGNACIRRIIDESVVQTFAGRCDEPGYRDGKGRLQARFDKPSSLALDLSGNVLVADSANHAIRIILHGIDAVHTLTGGEKDFADGTLAQARFHSPMGIAVATGGTGWIAVADKGNNRIRLICEDRVMTLAGTGATGDHQTGPAKTARFNSPSDLALAVLKSGSDTSGLDTLFLVIVADTGNNRIRVIHPTSIDPLP